MGSNIVPIIYIIVMAIIVSIVKAVKKKAADNTGAAQSAQKPVNTSRQTAKPAASPSTWWGSEAKTTSDSESSFGFSNGFRDSFEGTSLNSDMPSEEGIDPCHDDMEHVERAEEPAPGFMDRTTANELVRGIVISEVLQRKTRR